MSDKQARNSYADRTYSKEAQARIAELKSDLADADRVNELVKARHAEVCAQLDAKCEQLRDKVRSHTALQREAQALRALAKEVEEAPVVYGTRVLTAVPIVSWSTKPKVCDRGVDWATHRARLVRVERIDGAVELKTKHGTVVLAPSLKEKP